MAHIVIKVETDLTTKAKHRKLLRLLNRRAMERHRDVNIPRHFEESHRTRPGGGYGYRRRSTSYLRRKQRKYGHQIPMVYSGRLRTFLPASAKITATANRGRFRARSYFPLTVDRRRELEAVSSRERQQLVTWYRREYVKLAKTPEFRRKRRRK